MLQPDSNSQFLSIKNDFGKVYTKTNSIGLKIYNSSGLLLANKIKSGTETIKLDVSGYQSGLYIMRLLVNE